ncbi:hypothetical protein HMPREF6745_0661 [Prevotella sp. oral taxon 472 str. F0295]|nr:hypothetical protein [Prevotella sp. oral taxon 472]EEX53861.1 hypothetical protein HMPREF6745_0661 [Prevotella sp. oral taxon 472 str. F0295]
MAIEYKNTIRRPTLEELLLIEYLAQKGQYRLEPDWQQGIWVEPITEERIGPIAIAMNNGEPVKYKPSHVISDCMFYDADNKGVAAYLLVDGDGCLCELDLWKGGELEMFSLPSSTDKFEDIPMGK